MAESLFCRLQKLNKEAVPGPWFLVVNDLIGGKSVSTVDVPMSLEVIDEDEHAGKRRHPTKLELAVAPFVEEQP